MTALSVSTYFKNNPGYDYTCYFYDIRKTQGTSNSSASAWCSYFADNDECEEFGYLDVTCDIYGDIVDEGQCVSRDCCH